MPKCKVCGEDKGPEELQSDGTCHWCAEHGYLRPSAPFDKNWKDKEITDVPRQPRTPSRRGS